MNDWPYCVIYMAFVLTPFARSEGHLIFFVNGHFMSNQIYHWITLSVYIDKTRASTMPFLHHLLPQSLETIMFAFFLVILFTKSIHCSPEITSTQYKMQYVEAENWTKMVLQTQPLFCLFKEPLIVQIYYVLKIQLKIRLFDFTRSFLKLRMSNQESSAGATASLCQNVQHSLMIQPLELANVTSWTLLGNTERWWLPQTRQKSIWTSVNMLWMWIQ